MMNFNKMFGRGRNRKIGICPNRPNFNMSSMFGGFKQPKIFDDMKSFNKWAEDASGTPGYTYPRSYGWRKQLVYMKPDEFMKLAQEGYRDNEARNWSADVHEKNVIFQNNVDNIKPILLHEKGRLNIPVIETKKGKVVEHEGRHRAIAAKQLGMEKIPVYMVESNQDYIKDIEKNNPKKASVWQAKDPENKFVEEQYNMSHSVDYSKPVVDDPESKDKIIFPDNIDIDKSDKELVVGRIMKYTSPEAREKFDYVYKGRGEWKGRVTDDFEFDVFPKDMRWEGKKIVLSPDKNNIILSSELKEKENTIYRGMHEDEYTEAKKKGFFKSKGEGNIGEEQKGYTFGSKNIGTAAMYGSSFAPRLNKPLPGSTGIIVGFKNNDRWIEGNMETAKTNTVGLGEMGTTEEIPVDEIEEVYEFVPTEIKKGEFRTHKYYDEIGIDWIPESEGGWRRVDDDSESKDKIRWGDKEEYEDFWDWEDKEWKAHKNMTDRVTHKSYKKTTPFEKMHEIMESDTYVKQMEEEEAFGDDNYFRKLNSEKIIALRMQGYDDDEIIDFLGEYNRQKTEGQLLDAKLQKAKIDNDLDFDDEY